MNKTKILSKKDSERSSDLTQRRHRVSSRDLRRRNLGEHDKTRAAVFHPAFFIKLKAGGSFLAVADRHQAVGGDPLVYEEILSDLRAFGAEREIVFGRTDVIAVAFDLDSGFRIGLQPLRVLY